MSHEGSDAMSPAEVLRRWFEAHRDSDVDAASSLMAPGARVRTGGEVLEGFDELLRWYQARRAREGPEFGYEVIDLLGGERHAVAVVRLSNGRATWRQIAVYRMEDGRIAQIDAYEDPPD